MKTIDGVAYDKTIGTLLDYQALAAFLGDFVATKQLGLLDLACGTGTLLCELRDSHPQLELCGIDNSRAQLAVATSKAANISYIQGDLLTKNWEIPTARGAGWAAHLGFCFLNLLNLEKAIGLLTYLMSSPSIQQVLAEVWAEEDQAKTYRSGQWYRQELPNGLLETCSTTADSQGEKAISLTMRFILQGGQSLETTYEMYPHPVSCLLRAVQGKGWLIETQSCPYRTREGAHMLLSMSRVQ